MDKIEVPVKEEQSQMLQIQVDEGVVMTVDLDSGERKLNELGYRQELMRSLSPYETCAMVINLVGVYRRSFAIALPRCGPAGVVWFWWIAAFFSLFPVLSMAEIASSLPVSGSLYYWAAHLAGRRYGPIAAWTTVRKIDN
eukprot:TRINITY_DN8191_c0_g1_i2.p1 TRINITY_DN8191_c0_g1~~TRINITY_DN8191_c0_g1_i2.p1  ORF type:complete len:140 (+),score=14.12 TRINITY_DN8191_c0_g1_i2:62-481(+)